MTREALPPDSLEKALFVHMRRMGADRLGMSPLEHDGEPWEVIANTVGTIRAIHVTAESAKHEGRFRSMVVVEVNNNGYRGGPDGLDSVLQALVSGVRLDGTKGQPLTTSFHVLPMVETPCIFRAPEPEVQSRSGGGAV